MKLLKTYPIYLKKTQFSRHKFLKNFKKQHILHHIHIMSLVKNLQPEMKKTSFHLQFASWNDSFACGAIPYHAYNINCNNNLS
jgi:hypothetical protein